MRRILSALFALIFSFAGLAHTARAQSAASAVRVTSPATRAFATDQSTIDLEGTVQLGTQIGTEIKNVIWTNQFGKRGTGTVTIAGNNSATWEALGIPLRPGINLIAITVVDAHNKSATTNLAINRTSGAAASLPVQIGTYKNAPVAYQVWNGMAVIEGDIIIGPVSKIAPAGSVAPPSPTPSSLAVAAQSPTTSAAYAHSSFASAKPDGLSISASSGLWPASGGIVQIPYTITGSSTALSNAITQFNTTFTGLIEFVTYNSQPNYVQITVEGGGTEGMSYVGMEGGPQTMTCGAACSTATWLHEMGHTVGLEHEHQRPDRGNYVTLNLANADLPNVPGNFNILTANSQTLGLYDDASIMEYDAFDLSKAGLPVIESIPPGIPLSNYNGYSAGDIDAVERLYGAIPSAVTVTTNPPGLSVTVDGTTYPTTPQTFNWALGSTHTLAVPPDPQVMNPTDGDTYAFGAWNDLGAASHMITVQPGAGTATAPATAPAVTMYEANYIRLFPFAFLSPASYPTGSGSVAVSPTPVSEFGGTFFTDRTLVTLTLQPAQGSGYNFYDWFNLPFPPSDNPHTFYIQEPITQAQAVYVSGPVTIVGASITGPNTWNPGLSGTVDSSFAYLPTGFSATYDGWTAGSTHTIAVDQTESPVTTNVYFNWNSWSDSLGISHSITQPSSGSQTISASFTPYYAFYTVPPAPGSANSPCYGGVTLTPVGTMYPTNTVFDFYADNTSVTATAVPNSVYPGMMFAGWSGSLTGNTNPDMVTIHDQFVPTASFNTVATPLAITTLSPPSATVSASNLDVTINGSGFSATTTYAYWNGAYRMITYNSSTQIVMHLSAGDLSAAGTEQILIGNYTTNSANATCGVIAQASFNVTAPAGAPAVQLSPTSVTFGSQNQGTSSSPVMITLTNTGNAALTISNIAITGTNLTSFSQTNTCPSSLGATLNCSISVTFSPQAAGALSASVTLTDNAGTQSVSLSGTGVAVPAITLNPTSIPFGSQTVGVKTVVPVTMTNNSAAAVSITSIGITPVGAASYSQTNNCGSSIAASGTCTIQVTFDPQSAGAKNDFVTVVDSAGSQQVALTGTGVASGSVTLNPTSIPFGSKAVGTKTTVPVTLTNSTGSSVSITSIAITPTGTVSYTQTNNCGSSIAASGTCTIQVSFDPQSTGAKNDFVTVVDSAGTQQVTLTGTGVAATGITLNPSSIPFGNQTVGVKTTTPVTVTNNTAAAISITSIAITPAGTVSYTQTNNCGTSIAASGTCTIQVSFDPQSTGAKNDFVTLTDSAGTQQVTLTGTGVAATGITLNPPSIAFGSQTVGAKTTTPVTVTNNTAAAISITSIAITPTGTVSYTQTNNCGSSIAASGTCTIQVSFDPQSTGSKTASVTLTDTAGTQTVALTGTGVASSIVLSPTSIPFGSQTVGTKTTVPVTVTNSSPAAITINSIAITPVGTVSYTQTNNCGSSIAASGTCTIEVSFDPQSAGAKNDFVTVTDSAGTQQVTLTGTGVAP